jgi:capsular exopolysaccharide synthesis family protein
MSKTYEALKRAEELRAQKLAAEHRTVDPQPRIASTGADDYYELRRRLIGAAVGDTVKTVLVVSPLPAEGASSVACLLARAMAERGRAKTLLVDLNLRTPALGRLMGAKNPEGFTSVLVEGRSLEEVIQSTEVESLGVVTAGGGYVDPIDIIDNRRTLEIVSQLGNYADVAFIDCAPVTLYPDARALAPIVDGVILVVEADKTPVGVANRAVELIRDTGANVLGVVLNKRHDYIPERILRLVG